MRDIKFRGRRVDNGKWIYGYLVPVQLFYDPDYINPLWIASGFENEAFPVITESVGQFTGLRDKNGKEIYEGDIFRLCDGDFYETDPVVVELADFLGGHYWLVNQGRDNPEYEVIGNIHENANLMNA
jgi:uncharacterized phage protein (TIGR01671 family)